MRHLKLWVGIVLVFVLGALVGALGSGWFFRDRLMRFAKEGPPPGFMLKRLTSELDMTAEQKRQAAQILKRSREKLMAFRKQHQPELQEIIAQGIASLHAILTFEQQQKLNGRLDHFLQKSRFKPPLLDPETLLSRVQELRFAQPANDPESIDNR